jgi:predicted Rossmann fold flavoprotein
VPLRGRVIHLRSAAEGLQWAALEQTGLFRIEIHAILRYDHSDPLRGARLNTSRFDVIVLGGGAAGLFAASVAGQRRRRVLLIERMPEVGKKILISGGGRCNFTNTTTSPGQFLSANPHFCKSALARYTPRDFVAEVASYGIAYHEKKLGQLFCDGSARQIVRMLLAGCAAGGVRVLTGCETRSVRRLDAFEVQTSRGVFGAPALVVATGGLSIPALGATDLGYRIARQFGLDLEPTRPALVPLVLSEADQSRVGPLVGVSTESTVSVGEARFREGLIFTHKGLSGPAVLQASSYWREGEAVTIDLLPAVDLRAALRARRAEGSRAFPATLLAPHMPRRLAETWCLGRGPQRPISQWSDIDIELFAASFHAWRVLPAGSEGYRKAEVTAGGISTACLSSKTLEARGVPGLFFVGEVVDVTGWLGGYNFQWAWASAHAAAQAV